MKPKPRVSDDGEKPRVTVTVSPIVAVLLDEEIVAVLVSAETGIDNDSVIARRQTSIKAKHLLFFIFHNQSFEVIDIKKSV